MVSELSTTAPLHPMMGWRYSLTRCLGRTALADVYWARDLEVKDIETPEAHVLLLKVATALNQLNGFEDTLYEILMPFTEARSDLLPVVTDSGNDNGTLWLVMPHTEGKLFCDTFQTGKDRHKLLQDLKPYLSLIAESLKQLEPPSYGFLEPAAIQIHDNKIRLLNAPLVKALRQYIEKTNPMVDYRLTLNSGYISPAVAVGDVPTPEDDVFSLACMSYHFLTGEAPFKKQHTLEAVVRHTQPTLVKRIPPSAQEALQQGLALQPGTRQDTPALFIKQLTKRPALKLILPTAVAAALAITGFATQHLFQHAETYIDQHTTLGISTETTVKSTPVPSTPVVVQTPTNATPVISSTSTAPVVAPVPTPVAVNPLEDELKQQIRLGGTNANLEPTIGKIREALAKNESRDKLIPLIEEAVRYEHTQSQTLLNNKDIIAANTHLTRVGNWIKEFSLPDQSVKQLELEKQLQAAQTQQLEIERLLVQAQEALAAQRWTNANGASNAALFLTQVLERQPQHAEAKYLLLEAIRKQQATIQQQISNKKVQTTQALITDIADLIKKQNLNTVVAAQTELENAFQTLKTTHPELVTPPAPTIAAGEETSTTSSALSAQDITSAIEQAAALSVANVHPAPVVATPTPAPAAAPREVKPVVATAKPEKEREEREVVATPAPTRTTTHAPAPIRTTTVAHTTRPVERPEPRPVLRQQAPSIKVELVDLPRARPTPPRPAPQRRVNPYPPATPPQANLNLQRHRAERADYQDIEPLYDQAPMRRAAPARPAPVEQPRRSPPADYQAPMVRSPMSRPQPRPVPQDNVDELMEVPLSSILN